MPKTPAIDDDLSLPVEGSKWTRESFQKTLERRYSPRLHKSCILAACGLTSMLASWFMLDLGVHSMMVRYPVAIALAYGTFLVGVWTWLRAMGLVDNSGARTSKSSLADGIDISSGGSSSGGSWGGRGGGGGSVLGGKGGSFDGGGASASFAEGRVPLVAANLEAGPASGSTSSGGKGAGSLLEGASGGGDGDGMVLLLLAIALVAVVFVTSGYLIWCAPDVLTEAAFGAALTGSLARRTKQETASGWISGVMKKTWWPFAVVMVAAMIFAGYAQTHYPAAATFRQAIAMAVQ